MINSLKGKDLIELDDSTGYIRTTEKWRNAVEVLRDKVFSD